MRIATFISKTNVTDPTTHKEVPMYLFQHDNGQYFAVEAKHLDYQDNNGLKPVMCDPFATPENDDPTIVLNF